MYEDDGVSLAYQSGEYRLSSLNYITEENILNLAVDPISGSYPDQSEQRTYLYIIHQITNSPDSVSWNEEMIPFHADSLALLFSGLGWSYRADTDRLFILGTNPTAEALSAQVFGFLSPNYISNQRTPPADFFLLQNYPNPFNPGTTIEFFIPETQFVTLKIYNLLGQELATLVNGEVTAGRYKYEWDAGDLAGGVYYYRLNAGEFKKVKKMIVLK